MTKDDALELALDMLENNKQTHHYCDDTWYSCPKHEEGCANEFESDECNCGADKINAEFDKAITAIKEALAQPVQCKYPDCNYPCIDLPDCMEQEPVADDFFRTIADKNPKPFPSPQRTWVGLTEEEIMQIWGGIIKYATSEVRIKDFARYIENKLKELNDHRI